MAWRAAQAGEIRVCDREQHHHDGDDALGGVERFQLSPDQSKLLVHDSSSYLPPQLATVDLRAGALAKLTGTRSAHFKARSWVQPQFVALHSTHGKEPVWAK